MSAASPLRVAEPAPAGTLVHALVVAAAAPGRPTYSIIAFWRGEALRWRATCLACGAARTQAAETGWSVADETPVNRFGSNFADAHDGVGCLGTFTTERDNIGAVFEELVTSTLGEHAGTFLDAVEHIALDGGTKPWVVAGGVNGAASLDASFAYLAALHRATPHTALVAQDQALIAQCPDAAGVTAFSVDSPEIEHGARRWWVLTQQRTLTFETRRSATPGTVDIEIPEEIYRSSDASDADTFQIEPYRLMVAVQLGAL